MSSPETMRVGFYARVSSDHQTKDNTVGSQVEALRERIAKDEAHCDPDLAFIDEGYSGSTLVRPALERLRDAAAGGELDRLYVLSPDRLARKYAYQVLLTDELARSGVALVFLNRAVGESPEDELLLQVQGVVSEYERAKIAERCRRGKLHAARQGRVSVMSSAPYGYRYVPRAEGGGEASYTIHLEEAQVVRQMFEWVATERISMHEVTRRLRDRGIPSPRGHAWWARNTVWNLLKNPTYKGTAAFGRTRSGERRPRLRAYRNKPEQPRRPYMVYPAPAETWITIDVPAIIDASLFAAVQAQLAENRQRHRQGRGRVKYLLQGLIACARCGYALCGITVSPKTAKRRLSYYRCCGNDPRRFGGERICHNKPVNAVLLEDAVWADVRQLLADPERIEAEYTRRQSRNPNEVAVREREKQRALIKSLQRGIGRLIDAYGDGLLDKPEFEPRITTLRERLARSEATLQSLEDEAAVDRELRVVIGQLQTFAEQVNAGLEQADWETRRKILCALVKRVEVDGDQVRVVYRVNPTAATSTRKTESLQYCSRGSDPSPDGIDPIKGVRMIFWGPQKVILTPFAESVPSDSGFRR